MLPVYLAVCLTIVYHVEGASSYSDLLGDISQLYQLQQPESGGRYGYFDDELVGRSMPDDWNLNLDDSDLFSRASLRDPEFIEQYPSLWGYQSVSGGTGEGKQQPKEVKTDKVLPAYCNPPNPCPIGYTADDNCVETFENTLDNNRRLLKQQDCPCDAEHMWSCPETDHNIKASDGSYADWMEQMNKPNSDLEDNMTLKKREKKGSTHMRYRRDNERIINMMKSRLESLNPYFKGQHREIAAKKGGKPMLNNGL